MFNATLKHLCFILLVLTWLSLTGCSNPEQQRAQQIAAAQELSQSGSYTEAIRLLEALSLNYPNDPEILALIGRIHAQEGDYTMAAFFLEQAYALQPENVELLYATYQAQQSAGQATDATLEQLARLSTATMTRELWLELGRQRAENEQTEAALEAYLKGVDPAREKPAAATAAAIGQLFARLDNQAQASQWLEMAADSDTPAARSALFELLELQLKQKNWPAAEGTIARLDTQFPGAVAQSQWQQAKDEIKRWRAAQQAMQAKLAAEAEAEAKKQAAAEAEQAAAAKAAAAAAETAASGPESSGAEDPAERGEQADDPGSKTQVVADLAAAEAMANQPALESPAVEVAPVSPGIVFDPSIEITPADPQPGLTVSFDQADTAPATRFSIETDAAVATDGTLDPEAFQTEQTPPAEVPKTLEELLSEAAAAEIERDYKAAIRKYWAAIGIVNNRAEIWNRLSRANLIDAQLQNADTAALEAVRLAPSEVAYTLDFLRVAQRSRPPEVFLVQLETAYERFPASPEITLTLARAHERISRNNVVARNLYQRFIEIAPNHPLVPEARQAAARLR